MAETKEIRLPNKEQSGRQRKPLRFEDFLDPNPFVRPWMERILPKNFLMRDLLIMTLGTGAGALIGLPLCLLGRMGEFGAAATILGAAYVFQSDAMSRYLAAGAKLRKEKKNARTLQS